MAPIPYSVSPRRSLNSSGGKKRANRSTRIPTRLAAMKWPNSCRMISAAKPKKVRAQLTDSRPGAHQLGRRLAGLAIGVVERLERVDGARAEPVQDALDHLRDAE